MSYSLLAEGIAGHAVKATDPVDVAFQGVDHEVAVGVTDGTVAGGHEAVFHWRGQLHVELDFAAVAPSFIYLRLWFGGRTGWAACRHFVLRGRVQTAALLRFL